jgi:hypothetical protein
VSRADGAIRTAAGVTVVVLAGIAGAISYSHMTELAHLHGEQGWRTHMFPLSVDGIEVVASLVLLADKRAARRSGLLPWAALIAGTTANFAANVAVGGIDIIGRAVSGWPAFALLIAVKLLFGLLDHPAAADAVIGRADEPPSTWVGRRQAGMTGTVPDHGDAGPDDQAGRGDRSADGRDGVDGPAAVPDDRDGQIDDCTTGHRDRPVSTSVTPDVARLMPAAREASATLTRRGQALTREALARQLRADGHAASNARVSALLKILAVEPVTQAPRRHGHGSIGQQLRRVPAVPGARRSPTPDVRRVPDLSFTGRGSEHRRRVRSQPRTDIDCQHDPPIRGPGQRQRSQGTAQPLGLDLTLRQGVIHRTVPTRCSATRLSSTSEVTGSSAHNTASVSSNSASARAVNEA